MGYKIRNKSLYYTVDGFKNNHRYKILHDYIPAIAEQTSVLSVPLDYLSTIRTIQSYRNISRHSKKFFLGDKFAEQNFILYLKEFFMTPETCESQVELQGNHLKRFADQFDREWELFSYNQHPVMLDYF